MAVAVLDVGKTNVKLVLFEGPRAVCQRQQPNAVRPGPPFPHADVEAIWSFLLAALREAGGACPIDTVVVTTHGATLALIDEAGLVLPVPDYEFDGFDAIEPDYAALRPSFTESGSPPLPQGLNWGRQLAWLQKSFPERFAAARHLLMYPQYWAWRLTGVARSEATSLGCHGDGWNPRAGAPSSLMTRTGWDRLLPPLADAWAPLGPLRPEIAEATGLGPDVQVLAGIHDSNASLLPHLRDVEPPFTLISTGTWTVIMGIGVPADRLDPARDTLINVDAAGRPVPTARFMGGREFAAIVAGAAPDADEADLLAVLDAGARALPAFATHGGPYHDRAGRIEGALPDRPGARAALAALYAALMTDDQLDALGAGAGPLIVEGSFAANGLYCAVLAALRPGQPVLPSPDTAGTAYGASLLADWPPAPAALARAAVAAPSFAARLRVERDGWRAALPG